MTRIEPASAPPAWLPLTFFHAAPVWGVVAGALLTADGAAAVASRWAPSTLALVHAVALGVLGNAMIGALLQFLPVAAGVRLRGTPASLAALHGALNGCVLALVAGFRAMHPTWLMVAAALATIAVVLLAYALARGLRRRLRDDVPRGIALAVISLLVAAFVGVAMLADLTGAAPGANPSRWIDVHASWGLVGWMLALLGAVSPVVVPMFQGVPPPSSGYRQAWTACVALAAPMATVAVATDAPRLAATPLALAVATWAVPTLWGQLWTPFRRGRPLRLAWTVAAVAMLVAAGALVTGADARIVGALALGVAAPLPVVAMLLEITAFIGWTGLQRIAPRGVRVPALQRLQSERARAVVVTLVAIAGALLVAAVLWPVDALARAAGIAMVVAHATVLSALLALHVRQRVFLRSIPA